MNSPMQAWLSSRTFRVKSRQKAPGGYRTLSAKRKEKKLNILREYFAACGSAKYEL